MRKEYKLLLLGTHESGKSTFLKQMRIIHGKGYSQRDRSEFREFIRQKIFSSMQAIVKAMGDLKIPFSTQEAEDSGRRIMEVTSEMVSETFAEHLEMLKLLWADSGVQTCYARSREYQLSSSAGYYLDDLDRLGAPEYVPTQQDVLHASYPTTGIYEYHFEFDRKATFKVLDVGGTRSERRKWIHCFENVACVIFFAAISEYDQVLVEDETKNRLEESLNLFDNILSTEWFKKTTIILFLNKSDLLEEKIGKSHLKDYFPEYDRKNDDAWEVREFIRKKYLLRDRDRDEPICWHYTCATDTENIKEVFESVRDETVQAGLRNMTLT